jgi:hypothetical protein
VPDRLYNLVSDYLRRENLQALPASQRSLMTLVLRKLLASSTFAIAGALDSMSQRLQLRLKKDDATAQAKTRTLPPAEIVFDHTGHDGKVSILDPLTGQSGWVSLSLLTVESSDLAEDYMIFAGVTEKGQPMDEACIRRLFTLSSHDQRNTKRRVLFDAQDEIDAQRECLIAEIEGKLQQRASLTELFAVRWSLT